MAYSKHQVTNFLKSYGYKFETTLNDSIDIYSKPGYADVKVPNKIVMDTHFVKRSVLVDSVMFLEFVNLMRIAEN